MGKGEVVSNISLESAQKSVERIGPEVETEEQEWTPIDKAILTKRLAKEDRWPEARERHDELVREQKLLGVQPPQRAWRAWTELEKEFPPLPKEIDPDDVEATEETVARHEASSTDVDIQADVLEAYRKLNKKGLSINQFDREGAYLFWKAYKDNLRDFLKEYGVKYLGRLADEDDPKKLDERGIELGDLIEKMEAECPTEVKCPKCGEMVPI